MAVTKHASGTSPLSPSAFQDNRPGDIARLVYWLAVVVLIPATIIPVLLTAVWPGVARPLLVIAIATWVVAGAAFVLVRSGRVVGASHILIVGLWFLTSVLAMLTGGLSSPALVSILFTIAFAGLLLGWRQCIAVAVVVSLTALAMAWAETAGRGMASPLWDTPWLRAGFFVAYSMAVAGLQISTYRNTRNTAESALRVNDGLSLAEMVYNTTSEGLLVTAPDGSIVDVNDAFLRIHGYGKDDVIGQKVRMLRSGKHDGHFFREMWEVLVATGHWKGEIWNRHSDGTLVAELLSISTVKNDEGNTTHYVGAYTDLTVVKQGEEDLAWLETHDPLTKLPNRALLEDKLASIMAQRRRQDSPMAVLFLDIDHFKDVNDSLGHHAGNQLLIEIARRCRSVVREDDIIGRSGGDEFNIIVSDFADVENLSILAQRLLSVVEEPVVLGEQEAYMTASIGIAVFPEDGGSPTELTRHADVATSRSKALGRNRFEFFSEVLQTELEHRVEVETRLREALKEDRLFPMYQPQVDLNTGSIVGIEALVRWLDADGSIIMPDFFIPVAESSDLILEIGDAVLRHACADMRILFDAGHSLSVAVNFSGRQLMEQDVAADVVAAVSAVGLSPEYLEVELTESSIVTRTEVAAAKVRSLRAEGVSISIDDFGTGYASMAYVMDFKPDKLKIDRGFVEGLPDDQSSRAIVDATIALAKGIGAKVLAEGPETTEQVRYLREHGCDIGQGYYFSKAVPLADLRVLLEKGPFPLPE